jgi:hypothetical protein
VEEATREDLVQDFAESFLFANVGVFNIIGGLTLMGRAGSG